MTAKRAILPVFVPMLGCPHACVFCSQQRITGTQEATRSSVLASIAQTVTMTAKLSRPAELAFYGGSFTAIPAQLQEEFLCAALPFLRLNRENSIRVSTRPDAVSHEVLSRLKTYGVKTVELGAQSLCDEVLLSAGRGHTARDVVCASQLVKEAGFQLVLQMMTGLPDDTPERARETARRIAALRPDGVRIYPTVIVRGTKLHDLWQSGAYREHTVRDAVELCAQLLEIFDAEGIPVIRLGLNPTDALSGGEAAAGAYHPAFGELVYSRALYLQAVRLLSEVPMNAAVTLGVSQSRLSAMVGQKRCNILALTELFHLKALKIVPTKTDPGKIVILCIAK